MPTTAEDRKHQLLADLTTVRQNILDLARSISPEQADVIFLGTWSVKDLIAHLIGWDGANLQAMHDIRAGQLPQFYAFHDRDWRTYNAGLVAQHRKDELASLLADAATSHQQLVAYLQTIPATECEHDRGLRFRGWRVTMARLLQAEAKDEQKHYTQLKQFVEQNDQADQG